MVLHIGRFLLMIVVAGLIVCPSGQAAADAAKIRLTWKAFPDAVMYELVVTDGKNRTDRTVLTKNDIYAAGVELDTSQFGNQMNSLWWQVRALNLDRQPISRFSDPQKLSKGEMNPQTPLPTARLDKRQVMLLYPAYSWIPVLNAASYEIEVLSAPTAADEAPADSVIKTDSVEGGALFDYYDFTPYIEPGTRWWRVRALDEESQPLGGWSEARPFTVKKTGAAVAAFGDSVTHGGGAVSNPPSDPTYDWTSYVGLPVRNLGRSGDTTATMLARFDQDVVPFSPKILVIMGGVNDLRGGTSAAEVIGNLSAIQEQCRQQGITPVFVTLSPVNPAAIQRVFNQPTADYWKREWNKVNAWIRQQRYYVDISAKLTGADGLLPPQMAADGLHPDSVGKKLIGQAVGDYLRANFRAAVKR